MMAPSIIYNNTVQGEVFLPRQIFVFGGFALRANSLGHLEQITPSEDGMLNPTVEAIDSAVIEPHTDPNIGGPCVVGTSIRLRP